MSPDWSAKAEPVPYAKLEDPQSLNLYSYVRNNPLSRTDPNGHCDKSNNATSNTQCVTVSNLHVDDAMKQRIKNTEASGSNRTDPDKFLVYRDIGDGHMTAGFGHVDDSKKPGTKITEEQAEKNFDHDVAAKEKIVSAALEKNGGHEYSQGEFNAMVDLVYNGVSLTTEKSPGLMKAMKDGNYSAMSGQLQYSYDDKGHYQSGLATRSEERKQIFLGANP